MGKPSLEMRLARFGSFEANFTTGELRKHGIRLKLQDQPFQVLKMLLARPGELVTREEIRQRLWPSGTFVDFDNGLNAAVNRLREALSDSAENPKFIETLPRRGYRFIASMDSEPSADSEAPAPAVKAGFPRRAIWIASLAVAVVVTVLVALNARRLARRLLGVEAEVSIHSVVVLPLENYSKDPEQDYFAEGMTDELITDLGQISALRVISRTSAMRYKATRKSLSEIARELRVDAVVEGSVERSGDRVRIRAQLIQSATDRHLWSQSYEGNLRDILALQDEVARAIAREIEIKLTVQEQARLASARVVNPEAYLLYLKGRYFWRRFTGDSLAKSIEYYQSSLEKEPGYALAYAGLADSYALGSVGGGGIPPFEGMPKAKAAAAKALELDGTLSEAHLSLALVRTFYDWDWVGADREFKRSIELNPNLAEAHHWYSHYFVALGRFEESFFQSERALELDPISPDLTWHLGWHYHFARQDDKAIEQLTQAIELDPNNAQPHYYMGLAYEHEGMFPAAISEFQKVRALSPSTRFGLSDLAHTYAVSGQRKEANMILNELIDASQHKYVPASYRAIIYVGLGDTNQAFAWLQKTCEEHGTYVGFLKADPRLDSLRSDPRFQDLLRRIGLAP